MSLGDNKDAGTKTAPGEASGQSLETLDRKRPGFCARESRARGWEGRQGLGRAARNRESRSRDERGEATNAADGPGLDPDSSKSTVKGFFKIGTLKCGLSVR